MKTGVCLRCIIATISAACLTAAAAERVALVIGNNDYLHARKLETAVGDARAVAAELRGAGFEVLEKTNLKHNDFPGAVNEFLISAKDASAVLFYFAGHGVESETYGGNFLLPVDAVLEQEAHLASQTCKLDGLLGDLERLRAPVRLVVLDCCRNNPLQGRSWAGTRGETGLGTLNLQRLDAATMVVFSASPGKVARNRARPGDLHSPFATAFLEQLKKPGGTALTTFAAVEDQVATLTGGSQRSKSFFSGSLGPFNVFVFRTRDESAGPDAPPPPPPDPYVLFAGKSAGERRLLEVAPGVSIPFRWCPPGTFTMGSSKAEQDKVPEESFGAADEAPAHLVTLTRGFWMAETEVTQGQWEAVSQTTLRQQFKKALDDPSLYYLNGKMQTFRNFVNPKPEADLAEGARAESELTSMYFVNQIDAKEWCARASRKAAVSGWIVTLPTEAQWEYACRAHTTGMGYIADFKIRGPYNAPGLGSIAWYGGNSSESYNGSGWNVGRIENKQISGTIAGPRHVGMRAPNPWGLHDMLGNVAEWCTDWYQPYPADDATDPTGSPAGTEGVLRGGTWYHNAFYCRSTARLSRAKGIRERFYGFRPILTLAK